jgi:hypothetical protein
MASNEIRIRNPGSVRDLVDIRWRRHSYVSSGAGGGGSHNVAASTHGSHAPCRGDAREICRARSLYGYGYSVPGLHPRGEPMKITVWLGSRGRAT